MKETNIKNYNKNLVFKECFCDEQALRKNGGTPAAGSTVYLGNYAGGAAGYKGRIATLKINKGIMTAGQIRQKFTSEKALFNL